MVPLVIVWGMLATVIDSMFRAIFLAYFLSIAQYFALVAIPVYVILMLITICIKKKEVSINKAQYIYQDSKTLPTFSGVYRRSIFKIRPNILIGLQKLRLRPKDRSRSRLFIYLIFLRRFSWFYPISTNVSLVVEF